LDVRRWLSIAALGVAVCASCGVDEIDIDGKACPCADGYACDDATQTCVKLGAATGGTDAGSDGAAGAGGTSTGGANTGGTNTGGTNTGGTNTGGANTGGTSTGGANTGGAGTGGGSGGGIACGGSTCSVPADKCCHSSDGVTANGTCTPTATACLTGFVEMFCDEASDCGGGGVCCERLSQVGNLTHIHCEAQLADCKPLGSGSATTLCNPAAPDCPSGKSCVATTRGYSRCE